MLLELVLLRLFQNRDEQNYYYIKSSIHSSPGSGMKGIDFTKNG